jgi:hypothetical protein
LRRIYMERAGGDVRELSGRCRVMEGDIQTNGGGDV